MDLEYYADGNTCFDDVNMIMEIDCNGHVTIFLCRSFASMEIEDKDNSIDNTQQSIDLEYYADRNSCFDDVDMMESTMIYQQFFLCSKVLLPWR
jgi:hypothetical protein